VYQAMVNVIADRLSPRIRGQYQRVTFGHMYAGRSNIWFYKPWRQGYKAFNKASRDAFNRGLKFTASFDLTACYDSLDYEVLAHFLRKLNCDDEFCERLKVCLGVWTATDTRIYHSHGIPQGPLSSGLLSEVVLRHFDLNYGPKSNVRYLRYVDDIRLFAEHEDALRRMLVRLDTLSKDIGLFPQGAKINIHKIVDIESEVKSISVYGASENDEDADVPDGQDQIRAKLIQLSARHKVENNARFKFLLSRADPSWKLNLHLLKVSASRPDLVPNIMRHLRKYDRLPVKVAVNLLDRLAKEPLYDNTTAEIVVTLDQRTPPSLRRRASRIMERLWHRRPVGPELQVAIGRFIFRHRMIPENRIRYFLRTKLNWWVRSELYVTLSHRTYGTVFLENVLNEGIRNEIGEAAMAAAVQLAYVELKVMPPLKNLNLAAARTLRQLGMISRLPKGVDGVERSFSRLTGISSRLNWRSIFKSRYKQAEKQAVFCRALADTNATAFVNATDVFNDLLLDRLFRHDRALGGYTLGNMGSVLNSARLRNNYPAVFAFVSEIHEKRYVSNLSHAIARRTGKPTRRIRHQYIKRATRMMTKAFAELSNKW
jgi:hypothetical protein